MLLDADPIDLEVFAVFAVSFSNLCLVAPLGVQGDIVGKAQVRGEDCSAASPGLEVWAVVENWLVVSYRSLRYAGLAASVVSVQKQLGPEVCFCYYCCHCRYWHYFAAIHQRNHSLEVMVMVEEAQPVVVEPHPAE